ncbi:MAG: hypothetical protein HFE76_11270 [Firmicutes bacterium]|nr:hypothetical protein [Bacillota bacterium]
MSMVFTFKKPVQKGDILTIHSRIVKTGTTSMMVHVKALCEIDPGRTWRVLSPSCVWSWIPRKNGPTTLLWIRLKMKRKPCSESGRWGVESRSSLV